VKVRKLKHFVNYGRVGIASEKSSSFAMGKSIYSSSPFAHRKHCPWRRLQSQGSQEGAAGNAGACGTPTLSALGRLLPPKHSSNVVRFHGTQLISWFFSDRRIPEGFRWEE